MRTKCNEKENNKFSTKSSQRNTKAGDHGFRALFICDNVYMICPVYAPKKRVSFMNVVFLTCEYVRALSILIFIIQLYMLLKKKLPPHADTPLSFSPSLHFSNNPSFLWRKFYSRFPLYIYCHHKSKKNAIALKHTK